MHKVCFDYIDNKNKDRGKVEGKQINEKWVKDKYIVVGRVSGKVNDFYQIAGSGLEVKMTSF